MNQQKVTQFLSEPINGPRIPPNVDDIVEEVARLELRKKNAVVTLAVREYVASHHPELLEGRVPR